MCSPVLPFDLERDLSSRALETLSREEMIEALRNVKDCLKNNSRRTSRLPPVVERRVSEASSELHLQSKDSRSPSGSKLLSGERPSIQQTESGNDSHATEDGINSPLCLPIGRGIAEVLPNYYSPSISSSSGVESFSTSTYSSHNSLDDGVPLLLSSAVESMHRGDFSVVDDSTFSGSIVKEETWSSVPSDGERCFSPGMLSQTRCDTYRLNTPELEEGILSAHSDRRKGGNGLRATFLPFLSPLHRSNTGDEPTPPMVQRPSLENLNGSADVLEDVKEASRSLPLETRETVRLVKRKDTRTGTKYINGYCLIKEIGRGSTSKVHLAYENANNRLVAIKQVRRASTKFRFGGPSCSQQVFEGFLREVEIVKKLRHKNIVSVYEIIDDPNANIVCLVMQYVDNGPIRKMNQQPNTSSVCPAIHPVELLGYARQMLAGLVYLHRRDVIHRDIKPENILINSEKRVFLADFGVAETFDDHYRAKLERLMATSVEQSHAMVDTDGPVVVGARGTMLFFAPELWTRQCSSGKPVDIWAMGVTLYILLTGKLPFQKLDDIINPALPKIPTEHGEDWADLLRGMLNRNADERLTAQEAMAQVSTIYIARRRKEGASFSRRSRLDFSLDHPSSPLGSDSCTPSLGGSPSGSDTHSVPRRCISLNGSVKDVKSDKLLSKEKDGKSDKLQQSSSVRLLPFTSSWRTPVMKECQSKKLGPRVMILGEEPP